MTIFACFDTYLTNLQAHRDSIHQSETATAGVCMFMTRGARSSRRRGLKAVWLIVCLTFWPCHSAPIRQADQDSRCLAPKSEVRLLSEKIQQRRDKLRLTLYILELVRAHFKIIDNPIIIGGENWVPYDTGRGTLLHSFCEEILSPRLSFLYTFQMSGIEEAIRLVREALESDSFPEILKIHYPKNSGIHIKRWRRFCDRVCRLRPEIFRNPALARKMLRLKNFFQTLWVAQFKEVYSPELDRLTHQVYENAGVITQYDEEKHFGHYPERDLSGAVTMEADIEKELGYSRTLFFCITAMDLDFNYLVEMLGDIHLVRESFFSLVASLEKAFQNESRYISRLGHLRRAEPEIRILRRGSEKRDRQS